jgi:hypothetical protein
VIRPVWLYTQEVGFLLASAAREPLITAHHLTQSLTTSKMFKGNLVPDGPHSHSGHTGSVRRSKRYHC